MVSGGAYVPKIGVVASELSALESAESPESE